jgi:hypothetical protein
MRLGVESVTNPSKLNPLWILKPRRFLFHWHLVFSKNRASDLTFPSTVSLS